MPAQASLTVVPQAALQAAPPATKRKNREEVEEDDENDSGSDVSMINVDFDFYNPNPEVDDIALKRLLRQLFCSDADLFDIHALATHILSTAKTLGVGSTVKVEGEESDPYAYLSLVDLGDSNPAIQTLLAYLISQLPSTSAATSPLRNILSSIIPSSTTNPHRVALVISERLVNLPVQLVPPMWKMTGDEVKAGAEAGNPSLTFSHYLLLSRVYKLEAGHSSAAMGQDDQDMDAEERPTKKSKKVKNVTGGVPEVKGGLFAYHPEEEFLEKVALYTHTYPFKTSQSRDSESFSVEQHGRVTLFEAARLSEGIALMEAGCQ